MQTRTPWVTWFWKGAAGRLVARQGRSGSRWRLVNRQYRWRNDAEAEEVSPAFGGAGTRWGGQHTAPRHGSNAGRWRLRFDRCTRYGIYISVLALSTTANRVCPSSSTRADASGENPVGYAALALHL